MDSIETTGKSVDDAILQALAKLGRRRDEVDVTVLQEPARGVRGVGAKEARVRVWLKRPASSGAILTPDLAAQWMGELDDEVPVPPARPAAPLAARPARPAAPPPVPVRPTPPAPPPQAEDDEEYEDDDEFEDEDEEFEDDEFEDEEDEAAPALTPPRPAVPDLDNEDDQSTAEGVAPARVVRQAAEILRTLLRQMNLPTAVEVLSRDPLTLNIRMGGESEALGLLIGRRGETLASLQLIVNLMLNRQANVRYHVLVDAEQYRHKRDENLRSLAMRVANQVQQSQRAMTLEPMTPYERRIVHMTLQESPYVQTQSTGEGEQRRVVVSLKPRSAR